jgi:hypothetical protein
MFLIFIFYINLSSSQQLSMDVIPGKELSVEDSAKIKLSINLEEWAKRITIKINVDKDILDLNNIYGDGIFNNIDTSKIIQHEDKITITEIVDGKIGTIYLPIVSERDGLRTISILESYFIKKENLERVNISSSPSQVTIYWKNPTIPAISFSLPPENKPDNPSVLKYVDRVQIYKNEPLKIFYLVYCPYPEEISLDFDENLTFSSFFKFFKNSPNKKIKFSHRISGVGYVTISGQTLTCDDVGKILLLPAQVTFKNDSGLSRTILSEPSFIEIEVKNRPPEIINYRIEKATCSSIIDRLIDNNNNNNNNYRAIINCRDEDGGKIGYVELLSDLDGSLYTNSSNKSVINCIIPFSLNNSGNHKIKLSVKDDNNGCTEKECPVNSEESQLIKFLNIFITGSILIAFIQLIINWEKICLWFSNRFFLVNKLIITKIKVGLRYHVNWRYIRAKHTYVVFAFEIIIIIFIIYFIYKITLHFI